jgi:bifunctional non-homologous end joining protein LigD
VAVTTALQAESQRVVEQLRQPGARLVVEADGERVALSSLDKILWPAYEQRPALTKRDLAIYLATVSPWLLPHLRDRPLTLARYPSGLGGNRFYQRHWRARRPNFVETVRLYAEYSGRDDEHLLCNNLATLLWLAQIGALELHTWYARARAEADAADLPTTFTGSTERIAASVLNYPDFLVLDLDPYLYSGDEPSGAEPELHRVGFARTCEAAGWLKEALDRLGLAAYLKTSGKTGLHLYVPIERQQPFPAVQALAEALAEEQVAAHPEQLTTVWAVKERRGKIFLDVNQNVRGKSLASVYSPRALPWATVSTPLRWDELGRVYPTDFTLLTVPDRLAAVGDLWADILTAKQTLAGRLPKSVRSS